MVSSWCIPAVCLLAFATSVGSVAIDNGISTGPDIQCDAHALILSANTRNPFSGRIYVKGESSNPDCSVNYTQEAATDIEISVPLMACNVRRLRIPGGAFEYTTTVVVSFHHIFETKVDRAYRVHCVFTQLNNTFTAPSIEVSMIPTTETLSQTAGSIQCQYEVRRGGLDGPPLRYAVIGEPVYHVWKCETAGMRVLVKDCYVDDGGGNKVATIDSRGCAIDRYVIQTPTYIGPDYTMVYTEAHVFKYADRPTVLFQCQIQMCDATDSACQDTTPPVCNGSLAPTAGPNTTIPEEQGQLGNQTIRPPQAAAADLARAGSSPRPIISANYSSPEPISNATTPSTLSINGSSPSPSPNLTLTLSQNGSNPSSSLNLTTTNPSGNLSSTDLTANLTTNLTTTQFPPLLSQIGNLTNETALGESANETSRFNATSLPSVLNSTLLDNETLADNSTLVFPTPGPMMMIFLNQTNDTSIESGNSSSRRIRRRTANDAIPKRMDSMVWDVISNEFTVMDLDQELKHNHHGDPEAQKLDDGSNLKQTDTDYLLNSPPDDRRVHSQCVAGYEIALAVSVVLTLIITSTAAVAVYWNVKNMRKRMHFHP